MNDWKNTQNFKGNSVTVNGTYNPTAVWKLETRTETKDEGWQRSRSVASR